MNVFKPYYANPNMLTYFRTGSGYASTIESAVVGQRFVVDSRVTLSTINSNNPAACLGRAGFISGSEGSVTAPMGWNPGVLKERVSNQPRWDLAPVTKEMVVAAYKIRKVEAIFENGNATIPERSAGSIQVTLDRMADILPWPKSNKYPGYFSLGGDEYLYGTVTISYVVATVNNQVNPYDVGFSTSKLEESFSPFGLYNVDPAWVQSSVARANEKALDWLTTVAEMPETVSSLIGAVKAARDVLKRSDRAGERIRENHKKWLASVKKQIAELLNTISKAKARTLRNKLVRRLKKLNKQLSREGKLLVDKLTASWMSYRYEIMPLVYTVKGAVEAAQTIKNQFFTVRDRFVDAELPPPPVPNSNWNWVGTSTATTRIMIKFGYRSGDGSTLKNLQKVLSANVALTAWELVSRSFVADWFVTVGDFLSAGFGFSESKDVKRVSTLSYKIETVGSFVEKNTGARVYVNYESYVRLIPDLGSYTGIYFRPNLSLKRMIDSFCLLWPTLKRSLRD